MKIKAAIREVGREDYQFIREMFYEAIYIPPGIEKPPFSIIDNPELLKYTSEWMKETDTGVIAETNSRGVGAAWARLFESAQAGGYGYINADTPELCLSVKADYRNLGLGTALLSSLFEALKFKGFKSISLSVDKENRAVSLYQRLGFEFYAEKENDYLMIKYLD